MAITTFNLPAPNTSVSYSANVTNFNEKIGNGIAECQICKSKGQPNVDLIGTNWIWKCKNNHQLLGPY